MTDKTTYSLDETINRHRRLLSAAEQIKKLLIEFPELNGLTVNGNGMPAPAHAEVPPPKANGTRFETIQHYFITHSNQWMGAPDLAKELNLKRATVTQVLWVLNKDAFEKRDAPGSKKKKEFRLKGPAK